MNHENHDLPAAVASPQPCSREFTREEKHLIVAGDPTMQAWSMSQPRPIDYFAAVAIPQPCEPSEIESRYRNLINMQLEVMAIAPVTWAGPRPIGYTATSMLHRRQQLNKSECERLA